MGRLLAKDFGRRNITVNTISPGPTETEGYYTGKTEQVVKMIAGTHPAGRIATVDEIANAVLFLASPEAQWINGHILRVNGGMAL
jgi:3-oxoacyl-[acyl-carrier protein] reductase